ncbi:MAG: hypothetical protein NC213_00970 [Acetobacter sp.]|nr:hypothetical protein [Bacteroides sp.]MCM1340299.1 hypothetical protein [Acetobacter sp.]MCM1432751.1 hypothetical protein [Clostridiales bacterium]
MKILNNLKLAGSFREISNALDIISGVVRIFAIALMIIQGILVLKNAKDINKS